MYQRITKITLIACFALLPLGCGGGGDGTADESVSEAEAMADALDEQTEVAEKQSEIEALTQAAKAARTEADRLASSGLTPVTPEDMVRGKKMKSGGMLQTTLKAGVVAEQKLNMIQWRQALDLYAAMNNLDYPKTHEEFMEKVIEANGITLEPLLEPYEYIYNPEESDLNKRVKQEAIGAAEEAAQAAEAALAEAQAAVKE